MKSFLIVAAAGAALAFIAPMSIKSAEAQTVVIKRGGHPHGHMHQPRRKKVIVIDRGRHHGWSRHQHRHGQATVTTVTAALSELACDRLKASGTNCDACRAPRR